MSLVAIVAAKRFIEDLLKNVNTENYLISCDFYCTISLSKSYFREPATCDFFIIALSVKISIRAYTRQTGFFMQQRSPIPERPGET